MSSTADSQKNLGERFTSNPGILSSNVRISSFGRTDPPSSHNSGTCRSLFSIILPATCFHKPAVRILMIYHSVIIDISVYYDPVRVKQITKDFFSRGFLDSIKRGSELARKVNMLSVVPLLGILEGSVACPKVFQFLTESLVKMLDVVEDFLLKAADHGLLKTFVNAVRALCVWNMNNR